MSRGRTRKRHTNGTRALPRQVAAEEKGPAIAGPFLESGRQDLNLRPPGPQPEGWGTAQGMEPVFTGFRGAECGSVALNLFPNLFPNAVGLEGVVDHLDLVL